MRGRWLFAMVLAIAAWACSPREVDVSGGAGNGPTAVTDSGGDKTDGGHQGGADAAVGSPDYGEAYTSPDDQAYLDSYAKMLEESADMTTDELFAEHYEERPYLASVGIDALNAQYLDLIDSAYALTAAEKEMLAAQGFFVTDRVRYDSHPMAYMDIYEKDLPVLVTTDSILFAIHKSYDLLLKMVETSALIPLLESVLYRTHARLSIDYAGAAGAAHDAVSDVDLYYTVARSLLAGRSVAPVFPANARRRDDLLADVESLAPKEIKLFGRWYPCERCAYDFSQFKPRGHYTESEELERYFKAMIWLGRTEMAPTHFQRELIAAWLMWDGLRRAGTRSDWQSIDRIIQAFVGKSDNLTMDGMDRFMADHPATLSDLADPATAAGLMEAMAKGGYAEQKIMSQIMAGDPMSAAPQPLPPIFQFLGQRFVIDSYVFSSVVFDRIIYEGHQQLRSMPSPLDPMFVLGFQEALPLLRDELDRWHYAQNLHALKYLVDGYDAAFWAESIYNVWLDAIRELAADTTADSMPDAVRTRAYGRKSMHAGMASWAELRHDTILYAKQSYTNTVCDYPDGYVEPFPRFFRKIETFANTSAALFAGLKLPSDAKHLKESAKAYFGNLANVGATLGAIAEKEIAQQPRLPEETAFLRSIVQKDNGCGQPPFSGWYRNIFFDATAYSFVFKATVADVHTDAGGPAVLHVATGRPNLMVLVANTSCGLKAYAGPASSYFEFAEPGFTRLTDEEWMSRLSTTNPPRPAWTADFVVPR